MEPIYKKASVEQIADIELDYRRLQSLGNSALKSAYLATSGRGFLEIEKSNKRSMLLLRKEDSTYICVTTEDNCSLASPATYVLKERARFHTDINIFD
jgi:hypothetical protein